ncbi:demethylmenaquinone methyltransferase-like isoform X2 [Gigantopelta aegis]|uniref:demethylmenaquinone methyltransferase-like isoform X2 n=1 Tax=Gigantopelta aegis TaxID=1735272 RepID=UPI001B88CC89|nr:demethylmenaquinone methyltransferase-like isoform X2 [Gigantopelta aegis]
MFNDTPAQKYISATGCHEFLNMYAATHDDRSAQLQLEECLKVIAHRQSKGLGHTDCIEHYHKTSDEYDKVSNIVDYQAPVELARTMADLFPDGRDKVKVLDAAAGTGLVGVELFKVGFKNLDAVDAAEGMLAVAESKHIYQRLICQYLGENKLGIDSRIYDAVTMCGGVGHNAVPAAGFKELLTIIKPGGVFVNATRVENASEIDEYRDTTLPLFEKLAEEGKLKLETERRFPVYLHGKEGVISVYSVL